MNSRKGLQNATQQCPWAIFCFPKPKKPKLKKLQLKKKNNEESAKVVMETCFHGNKSNRLP